MRLLAIAILIATMPAAQAATRTKPSAATAPFGTDWAKPFPQTGGYIYNDPRTRTRSNTLGRPGPSPTCPSGTVYVPASGRCQ